MRLLHALLSGSARPLLQVQRLIKSLSRSRKGFRLLRCTYSLPDLITASPVSALSLADAFNSALGFCNDLLDDVAFVGALGFARDSIVQRADVFAERIWFITCFFDIAFLLIKLVRISQQIVSLRGRGGGSGGGGGGGGDDDKEMEAAAAALRYKRFVVLIGLLKMFGDLTIATSYACNVALSKRSIALAGLVSGSASFYKLWLKAAERH